MFQRKQECALLMTSTSELKFDCVCVCNKNVLCINCVSDLLGGSSNSSRRAQTGVECVFAATIAILVVYREATQIENNSASILFTIAYMQNAFSVESPSLSTGNVFDFIQRLSSRKF